MCAYIGVNGVPACANDVLLGQKLRRDWGFRGHVVSDCGAAANIYRDDALHYVKTPEEAVTLAFKAGMDVICGDFRQNWTTEAGPIANAVRSDKLPEPVVDLALRRLIETRINSGLFDPPDKAPFAEIKADAAPDHRPLAREVADKSIVLLKNDGLLPIKGEPKRIAVIGPNADATDVLEGNYNGTPIRPVTVLAGIKARWPQAKVTYTQGVGLVGPVREDVPAAAFCQDMNCGRKGVSAHVFKGDKGAEGHAGVYPHRSRPFVAARGSRRRRARHHNRMDRSLRAPESGAYRFDFSGSSGYALWVDGKLVRQESADQGHARDRRRRGHAFSGKTYSVPPRRRAARPARCPEARLDTAAHEWRRCRGGGEGGGPGRLRRRPVTPHRGRGNARRCEGFFGGDRTAIDLPKPQEALLERVAATGKPLVFVLMIGSAVAVNWADAHVPAILDAWYPGVDGGAASRA